VVVLTTIGAKTGNVRKTPVMRIKAGYTYVAVYRLLAREVHGEEKVRWWQVADRAWPHFAEFRAQAGDREIPVMVLEAR
jgi:hypothetical protein